MFHIHRCVISALVLIIAASQSFAQPQDPPQGERRRPRQREGGPRGPGEGRGERGEGEGEGRGRGRGRGGRDFGRRMMEATPEEARQMRIDGWVQMLTRTYELSEEQQAKVKAEVTKISDEYRASLGKDAEEMDKIGQQMRDYWRQRRDAAESDEGGEGRDRRRGNPWEDPKFQELMGKMREIQEKHPIDWEGSIERVESLLPPEQAAKGRERREERMNQWRERANGNNDPELGPVNRRGRGGRRGPQREGDRGPREERRGGPNRPGEAPRGPLAGPAAPIPPAPPSHPWDAYVERFIDSHQLSESQAASARSIAKDMKHQAAALRESMVADKDMGGEARAKMRKELEARLEKMFEDMKARLQGLLTAEQRAGIKKA